MLSFLSAEVIYGLLLVTTFASVGLLGLWAATSRWHPFLRTTIVLAILSVLLLRPMFEPFVMLVSQVATIALGVAAYRWLKNRKQVPATDAKQTRYQFSLRILLFVSTLVALGAAIVAKLPELGWRLWLGYFAVGIAAGLGMLGVALFVAPAIKWRIRLVGLLGAILFCSLAFAPLQLAYENYTDPNHVFGRSSAYLVFSYVVVAALVLGLTFGTWKLGNILEERKHPPVATKFFYFIAFALWVALALLPTYVAWRLLNPLPPLALNTATPNSFHELAKLGNKFDRSPLITAYNADPVVMSRLANEVANHQVDYEQLDRLLKFPCFVPDAMKGQERNLLDWRSLAYATVARADVARDRGQLDAALSANEQTLQIARGFRGGIFNDYYLGLATEGLGIYSTFESRTDLNAMQCQQAVDALRFHDENREPLGDIVQRDQHWVENSDGWLRHLHSLLLELVDDSLRNRHISMGEEALHFKQAILRLTMTELALRKNQLTHNTLPDRLEQLVPDILPEVPRDPFDPAGGPLRYKKTPDGYLLYSVGQNGVDDGGVAPESILNDSNELRMWSYDKHGDLRIDYEFADEEIEASADVPDAEEAASEALPD